MFSIPSRLPNPFSDRESPASFVAVNVAPLYVRSLSPATAHDHQPQNTSQRLAHPFLRGVRCTRVGCKKEAERKGLLDLEAFRDSARLRLGYSTIKPCGAAGGVVSPIEPAEVVKGRMAHLGL